MENRISKLEEEYYMFCLGLLQKLPESENSIETLLKKIYQLHDQLREEIKDHLNNCKNESIKEVEREIEKLRALTQG